MRVLGIDPGSRTTGWGVVEARGSSARALGWGRVSPRAADELGSRLAAIANAVERALDAHAPELVAIERPFHGENVRSLIVLAEARGALLAAVGRRGLEIVELAPAMVKSAVAGSGRADKEQVAKMVRLALGLGAEPLSSDESDALAIALAAASQAVLVRSVRRL